MPDVRFMCPRCRQKLVIDEAGVGTGVKCPTCEVLLLVPKFEDSELKKTQQVLPFEHQNPSPQKKVA